MTIVTCAVAAFVIILTLIIYYASKYKFNYWETKKVPHMQPVPLLGNYSDYILLKTPSFQVAQKLCHQFPNEPYFGTYYGTEPALVVQDPDIIKLVLTKDFYYFNSREIAKYTHKEVITQNVFFAHGDRWKVMRQNLTPLFSSTKMKNMFYLIETCAHTFQNLLDYETSVSQLLEVRALMSRYTMDCIGSCVFGIETKTMEQESQNNPFTMMGQLMFEGSIYRGFKNVTRAIWPAFFYGLGFKFFPDGLQKFFSNLLVGVFENRGFKPSPRNDLVDHMLSLKANKYLTGDGFNTKKCGAQRVHLEVDNALLVSHCVGLFGAGFETSANTMSFTLYELAKNQEAQRLAQQEVDDYLRRHQNKLNYDCVTELPYLNACVDEALRLYPILGIIARETVEDYTFPSGLHLGKGVRVHVPVYHLHHNPEHFPEPELYRPERFLPEAKQEIKPYTFFPFGEGPRLCIGKQLAKMQVFSGLITLLKKYNVELADGMPRVLDFEPTTILIQPRCGLNLKVTPRSGWASRVFA